MPPTQLPDAPDGAVEAPVIERVPMMQQVLDSPFLLLFLGVTLPTVFYLIWGILEIASIPLAPGK